MQWLIIRRVCYNCANYIPKGDARERYYHCRFNNDLKVQHDTYCEKHEYKKQIEDERNKKYED